MKTGIFLVLLQDYNNFFVLWIWKVLLVSCFNYNLAGLLTSLALLLLLAEILVCSKLGQILFSPAESTDDNCWTIFVGCNCLTIFVGNDCRKIFIIRWNFTRLLQLALAFDPSFWYLIEFAFGIQLLKNLLIGSILNEWNRKKSSFWQKLKVWAD